VELTKRDDCTEDAIAGLLKRSYRGGCIHFPRISAYAPSALLKLAIERGFMSEDGYVTRKGRTLLTRYVFA